MFSSSSQVAEEDQRKMMLCIMHDELVHFEQV